MSTHRTSQRSAESQRDAGAQTLARKLHIGHTSITWLSFGGGSGAGRGAAGANPAGAAAVSGGPAVDAALVEAIVRDISSLGFWGVEMFGNVGPALEPSGGLGQLLQKCNGLPLISIVASPDCADPAGLNRICCPSRNRMFGGVSPGLLSTSVAVDVERVYFLSK